MILPRVSQAQSRLMRGIVATTFTFFLFLVLTWLFHVSFRIQISFPSFTVAFVSIFLLPAIIGGYIAKDISVGAKAGAIGNLLNVIIIAVTTLLTMMIADSQGGPFYLSGEWVYIGVIGLLCGFVGGALGGFLGSLSNRMRKRRKEKVDVAQGAVEDD